MGRTFACSDLHGMLPLWKKIVAFLEPDDKVYVLGDCIDKGPFSWETLKAVINEPRAVLLKGNHEDMFVQAGRELLRDDYPGDYTRHHMNQGGYITICGWQGEEERFQGQWLSFLDKLPEYAVYQNIDGLTILLSHAGCTPLVEEGELYLTGDLLWNRDHFKDNWPVECGNVIVIHGHTPNCFIDEEINQVRDAEVTLGAYWYCNNHKICLDTGAYWSDTAVLLDLDDFTEYIVQGETENEE